MIKYKKFNYVCEDEKAIRTAVFIEEQGFKNEFDELDDNSYHLVFFSDDVAVGCLRYFTQSEGEYHIGRVAVLPEYRKLHIGSLMIETAEKEIYALGGKKICLSAQCRVAPFYEKNGYVQSGEVYLDEFCPHIHMEK